MSEMDRVKSWLNDLKSDNPELAAVITEIEPYLSEKGFFGKEFEAMVQHSINKIESDLSKLKQQN